MCRVSSTLVQYLAYRTVARVLRGLPTGAATGIGRQVADLYNGRRTGLVHPWLNRDFQEHLARGGSRAEWLVTASAKVQAVMRAYLGELSWAVESARHVDDYVGALAAEFRTIDGAPFNLAGRSWDYDRFGSVKGLKWRPGLPVNMPRPKAGDYPTYQTALPRYLRNIGYSCVMERLGKTFDGALPEAEVWRLFEGRDLSRRLPTFADPELGLTDAELLFLFTTRGYQPLRQTQHLPVLPREASKKWKTRNKEMARLQLRVRHGYDAIASTDMAADVERKLGGVVRRLSDGRETYESWEEMPSRELLRVLDDGNPRLEQVTWELEHTVGVQRAPRLMLDAALADKTEVRRLIGISDPGGLMLVTPEEHAFQDWFALTLNDWRSGQRRRNPLREDVAGEGWVVMGAEGFDERVANPFVRLESWRILELTRLLQQSPIRDDAIHGAVQGWLVEILEARGLGP